jgi:hypothetical protein
MAGLLDFLGSDDARLGIGLLGAAGPSLQPMTFGQRLQQGLGYVDQQKQEDLKRQFLQSQIAENTSQDAIRKAQLARQARQDAYFLGSGFADPSTPAAAAPSGGLLGAAPTGATDPAAAGPAATSGPATQGPPAPGSALYAAAGAPPGTPAPTQGKFAEWSKQYGIPVDALVNDYLNNGGKGIAEMLYKRGTPDMQVSNGFAYDKNRLGVGFLPQLNVSQNGQTSMVRIGADGLPVVSAPQGAVSTFGAYQGVQNRSAADYQPETVLAPNGSKVLKPRSEVLQPSSGQASSEAGMRDQVSGGMGFDEMAAKRELAATESSIKTVSDPQSKQALTEYASTLRAQIAKYGGGQFAMPTGANVVELSPAQQAQNKAATLKVENQAKLDAVPASERLQAYEAATDAIDVIDKTLKHPGLSTATGLQGYIDPRNYIPGTDAKGFQTMLDQVKGGAFLSAYQSLRGGGAITEIEGKKAEQAVARLNKAQSTSEFTAALNDYRSVLMRGMERARERAGIEPDTKPEGAWAPNTKQSSIGAGGWSATLKK